MKKMRRFAAIAAAAAMTACMAVPMMSMMSASATTITVKEVSDTDNQNFSAYQILDATVDTTKGAYTYKLNDKYTSILTEVTGKSTLDDITAYIAALQSNTPAMRTFADAVYKKIVVAGLEADYTTSTASFDVGEDQGYYLIAENISNSNTDATASLVMVDTAGDENINVTIKKELPTFDKQIGDIDDSTNAAPSAEWDASDYTWGEDADHDKYATDEVPFRLIATLPADYASYDHYTLKFHDDLQGDVYGEASIKAVYLADADGEKIADITAYTKDAGCSDTHGGDHGDGCDFVLTIADLKAAATGAVAGNTVVVEYTAPFTSDTVVGPDGNWNSAQLEYSNNPYNTGSGAADNTTSKTVEDSVVAFTYTVEIDKVDGSNNPLAGAAFKLEKYLADGTMKTVQAFTAGADTTFTFEGLDDGKYLLTETTTPGGYNGIKPIEFTVSAEHADEALKTLNGTPTTAGEISFDVADGVLSADVQNKSGTELPSTGGIGTTLFYVIGGTLAAGAGVSLIAKKRMKNED